MIEQGTGKTPWDKILGEFLARLSASDAVDDKAVVRLGELAKTGKIASYQSVKDALWPPQEAQP